ncbi:YgfZ/GcvT domain-containing protein [Marinomonas posidonica]|uniref:Folate-binding protein YgfZ n=1 Tax=Marinomonas posidonica (strain CECT 7376 / NCIMB 14433 / IVIA-Po-181) TaxID=491952 RepID=F6CZH4_MARPP|nr:folate-binding protein YgfZ [Marinomonas posidonica]AEF55786.1 folate-binding protein YgfZ [Marinomonas posidonica IVIA-Po-181]
MLVSSELVSKHLSNPATYPKHDIGVLSITGADSKKFLQGQTTCDMNKLSAEAGLYGAICSNKGRIICNFFMLQKDDVILMLMNQDLIASSLAHLKKYAVFFKTDLTDATETFQITETLSISPESAKPEQLAEQLPIETDMNSMRMHLLNYPFNIHWQVTEAKQPEDDISNAKVAGLSLLAARPLIKLEQSESLLPQWINMQTTGGISFTKGCYTGQEIVARMQYRGKSKKQLALATWQGDIDTQQALLDGEGKNLGQVLSVEQVGDDHIAQIILNQDITEFSELFLDGAKIHLIELPYQLPFAD